MKINWKIALLSLFVILFIWSRSDESRETAIKAPDKQLVNHFNRICKIADKGVKRPTQGVQNLFAYFGQNSPDILKQWGDLLVTIERIKDDTAHDKRAVLAQQRISSTFEKCSDTYEAFAEAIESNPAATRLFENGCQRLLRTVEILLGEGHEQWVQRIPGLEKLLLKN